MHSRPRSSDNRVWRAINLIFSVLYSDMPAMQHYQVIEMIPPFHMVQMPMKLSMNRIMNYALLVLVLAPATFSQAANLYKWTDEVGTVHYTQIPPTERPSQAIAPEQNTSSNPTDDKQVEQAADPFPAPEEMTHVEDTGSSLKHKNCEAAQKNLSTFQSKGKIIQPDGTEMMPSEEMRESMLKEIMQQITTNCE